ncbi:MAG: toxic anion resistance protein [Veillonellaceae bacterium]|nr:toxic anion resistance protein [Veillonellaceae bacterium]MDD6923288.1 toxic anion resistance protein [Veillonellaceae bacterium]
MADINLDDLLQKKQADGTDMAPKEISEKDEVRKALAAAEQLTPAQRSEVNAVKNKIDFTDTASLLQYGNAAQKNIADFSDSVLSSTRTKDAGEVGGLLKELVTNAREFEHVEEGGSFLSKIPIVGSMVKKADDMKMRYDKISTQIARIEGGLENAKQKMMKDIVLYDTLYEKNLEYFKQLEIYIRAGEEKVAEMRQQTLPKLEAQAAVSNNPMAAQVVQDFKGTLDRFEKKVTDLKITKTIAVQTAPQIRLIQNNDKILADRVQSAIYNTIPLWKNQMVIALGLSHQQNVLKMQQRVNDMTNELLKKNAEMLKQNSIGTAKENQRSIVDIETVKKVNDELIATIQETVRIQDEGHTKRMAAEKELEAIENRLKETMLSVSKR